MSWLSSPTEKAKAEVRAKVQAKRGIISQKPNGSAEQQNGKANGLLRQLKEKVFGKSLVILVVGAAIMYWGMQHPLRTADVGKLGWDNWFSVLVVWGTLAALIAVNSAALGKAAPVLHKTLAGIMFMIFVGFPVWDWASGHESAKKEPLLFSMPPGGRTELIPANRMHVVMDGDNFRLHNVYRDGHECAFGDSCVDGPLSGVYATNLDKEHPNTVSVRHVP